MLCMRHLWAAYSVVFHKLVVLYVHRYNSQDIFSFYNAGNCSIYSMYHSTYSQSRVTVFCSLCCDVTTCRCAFSMPIPTCRWSTWRCWSRVTTSSATVCRHSRRTSSGPVTSSTNLQCSGVCKKEGRSVKGKDSTLMCHDLTDVRVSWILSISHTDG